ncbi:DNRLRE domain-containing protein [Anaerofustis stercorihominis]|uniref:DNRLRE domain-containing protein n=2 Tax=Anaerofustis TaxID=264995 RepID=UPI00214B1CA6|nr:DNRLRE domain-containing protein [Anaerofustis stercorihominis]MCR2033420.1 DNRLRE domain-containing protein [Anaerofustis stercorihominis]
MKEERKIRRRIEKFVSLLVAFLLFFEVFLGGFSPIFAKASENSDVKSMRVDTSRKDDVIEKGKDYTIYENEDGSRTIDMYTDNVREKDENGEYVDYDSSIETLPQKRSRSASDYKYKNVSGVTDVMLPSDFADNKLISVSKDGKDQVTFRPIFEKEADSNETKGELQKENVTDIYEGNEEKNTKIIYGTDDKNVKLEYIPLDNGIKENIILNKKPDNNKFYYELTCKGMVPTIPEVGGVLFNDKISGEEKGAILVPYMTDSSEGGAYSEDLHYSLEEIDKENDKYKLILTVSRDYLDDDNRIYPVIIDPTYTAKSTDGVKDVYIESGYPTSNFYVSTIRKMPIGYGSTDKVCRTLMKFPELSAKIKNNYVTSAALKLYELSNGSPFSTVEVHKNASSWALGEVTWNKRPKWTSTVYASKKLSNTTAVHSLNITKLVQEWARGTQANYGILLKASVESSGTKNYNSFHGTRSSTAAKRPTLSVNYTVPSPKPPGKAEVTVNGAKTVYVNNKSGDKALAVKWTGVTSNCLEAVQARHIRYKADNVFDNATETMAYKNTGTVAASGTYNTKAALSSGWSEGRYGIGIRGVDKGNNKGSGTYCYIYVDNTAPNKVSNIKLTSSRDGTSQTTSKVKVTYTSGSDPGTNSSGVAKHNIILYGEDGNVIQNVTTANMSTYTFTNVEANQNVYVKIASIDKANNKSAFVQSANHSISNMVKPEIDHANTTSSLSDDTYINNVNKEMFISWKVNYKDGDKELNLGKITCNVLKEDGIAVSGFSEKNLVFPSSVTGYPKEYKEYDVSNVFGNIDTLVDGKYKVRLRFYSSDNLIYDEKDFIYNKDTTSPEIDINTPDENAVLKLVSNISYTAADAISGIKDSKIYLVYSNGKEKLLTENSGNYNFDTTNYDEGNYKIKIVVNDKAGNKNEVLRNVSISNPPPTPIVDFAKVFGGSNDNIELNYSWVRGDESISKVDHIEYAMDNKENWISIQDSNPNIDENNRYENKTANLSVENLKEGTHTFYFKAVDHDGVSGTIRSLKYTVDATAPVISISKPAMNSKFIDLVFLKGTVEDPHLLSYDVMIANGENTVESDYTLVKTVDNPKEKDNISGTLAVLNLKDNDKYPIGQKLSIKVKAKDTCNNVNNTNNVIVVEKKDVIHHDADFSVEKTTVTDGGKSEDMVLVGEEKASFSLKTLQNESYNENNTSYYIDGSTESKGEDGKFDFSDNEKFSDDSIHSLIVRDTVSETPKYSVPTYDYNLYDNIDVSDETLTNLERENNLISLTDKSISGEYIIKSDAAGIVSENTLSLKVMAEDTIPEGCEVEYYLSLNDKDYIKVNNDEEYYLGGSRDKFILDSLKLNNIKLKAVLKGNGENSPSISSVNVLAKGSSGDVLKVDMMNKYNPKNVQVKSGLNYRTKISWDKVEGADNDNVIYEIYRSEGDTFDVNKAEVVAEGVKDNYWFDSYTPIDQYSNANNNEGIMTRSSAIMNYEKDFSYKVKAVKDFSGKVRKSNGTLGNNPSTLPALNEYTKRLGDKDYLGYFDFETPVSNGKVEQSMGNFVYEQSDGSVKGKNYDIDMSRVYNSNSTSVTPLGIGWDYEFNQILLQTYDEYGDEMGMVYKDGSGTIYNFAKIKNEKLSVKENIDEASGNIVSRETKYQSPFGTYILLTKIEKLDIDDIDSDGDLSEVIDVNYIIKTKDGDTSTFDRNSQIISTEDRNGNTMVYRYFDEDINAPMDSNIDYRSKGKKGLLKEVEVLNGKSISEFDNEYKTKLSESSENQQKFKNSRSIMTFEYNDENMIERVNMPHGKYVTYSYKNVSFGLGKNRKVLASVNSHVDENNSLDYSYGYSSGSNLSTIKDGENNEYTIDYYNDNDKLDMVKKVTYPNGEGKSYEYSKIGGDESAQKFDKTTEYIHKKADIGDKLKNIIGEDPTVIASSEVKYNVDGNIIYSKDAKGNEVVSEYENGLEVKTTKTVDTYTLSNGTVQKGSKEKVSTTKYDSIPDNNSLACIADTKGNVLKETAEDGSVTEYKYDSEEFDADSEITTLDGKTLEQNKYDYDEKGNILTEEETVSGDKTINTYDEDGELLIEENITAGNKISSTSYVYDDKGNTVSETTKNASGSEERTTNSEYDKFGRVTKETDAKGYSTMYEYDGYDRVIKTTKNSLTDSEIAEGGSNKPIVTENRYNNNGSLVYEKKEDGSEITYEYDDMNKAVRTETVKDGQSSVTTNSYGYAEGNETDFIMGNEENRNYDFLYKETSTTDGIESISYSDVNGQNVKEYSRGNTTYNEYDNQGQLIKTFNIEDDADVKYGRLTMNLYDEKGQQTCTIENPIYDAENKVYTADDQKSLVTTTKYDKLGNKISETDPMGNETKYGYTEDKKLNKVILPGENVTETMENISEGDNTKAETKNALGNKSEEVTDSFGNTVEIRDIGKGTETEKKIVTKYDYDKNDNKVKETYSNGDYKTFSYDYDGKLLKEEHFRKDDIKKSEDIVYSYDLSGNVVKVVQSKYSGEEVSSVRYTLNSYDGRNRLVSSYEGEKETPSENERLRYSYNDKNELIKVTYPNLEAGTKEVIYEYSENGKVMNIKAVTSSSSAEKLVRQYTYSPKGNVENIKDYTGFDAGNDNYILRSYEYDLFDRVTHIKYANGDDLTNAKEEYKFTYDKNGNILTEEIFNDYLTEVGNKIHAVKSYTYDELGRLTKVEVTDKPDNDSVTTTTYTYDKVGNRLSRTKDGAREDYEYNDLNELLKVKSGENIIKEYSYDANGNTKKEVSGSKETNYSYDISNQMTKYEAKGGENVTLTQNNEYNYEGQRIRKEVVDSSKETPVTKVNNYVYDRGNVICTTDNENKLISSNILNLDGSVISSARLDNSHFKYHSYNKDTRNSTSTLVGDDNVGIVAYKYDEFGGTEVLGNTSFENEVCYTGQVYDKETGDYYYNARYYNPEDGRFVTVDTYRGEFEEPLSLHLYAYCANNPINFTDPSGHKKKKKQIVYLNDKLDKKMNSSYNHLLSYIKKNVHWYKPSSIIGFYKHFVSLVKTGGAWDLKRKKEWKFKKNKTYYFYKTKLKDAADVGNIHFGYVGFGFFSRAVLCAGAGAYQIKSGTSKWKFWWSYGDDPRDTQMIRLGYNVHWDRHKNQQKQKIANKRKLWKK